MDYNTVTQKSSEVVTMLQTVYTTIIQYAVKYGFQVLFGLVIIFIGFKVAGWVTKAFLAHCEKKKFDVVLANFLAGVIRIVILIFTFIVAAEKFGITISPFIASIGALIFGASFAIQAPLSNYAAGLSIILSRPFTVGDTITVQGVTGVVHEVKLPCTVLVNGDGESITIPNKDIVGQIIENSAHYMHVVKTVGIAYSDSPEKAIQTILGVLKSDSKVAKTPAPHVGIDSFGDSAITIGMHYWVNTTDYVPSVYAVNLAVFNALKAAHISIPFPQREVRFLNQIN